MKRTLQQKEELTGPEPRATISAAAVEQENQTSLLNVEPASAACVPQAKLYLCSFSHAHKASLRECRTIGTD